MKKIISILLLFAMLVSFASCHTSDMEETSSSTATTDTTETTDTSETVIPEKFFKVPDDEKEVTRVIKSEKDYGLKMEVTLHGYQSESLNKDFYVKNNEYFIVDVKIINDSPTSDKILQFMSTDCRNFDPPHNHELEFYFANRYGDHLIATSDHRGFVHPERYIIWELKPGESETYTLKLAAGKQSESSKEYDLPYDGWGGIELYDESIYENGSCLFIGYIYFPYAFDNNQGLDTRNNLYIATELSFEVVYVSDETTETTEHTQTTDTSATTDTTETSETTASSDIQNQPTAFVRPEDQKYQRDRLFSAQNEDISLEVVISGIYASESLGEEAYFTRDQNIYMDIYIKNISDHSIYFHLSDPIGISWYTEPTEFSFDLKTDDGYTLGHLKGDMLPDLGLDTVELKPGEEFIRNYICFAAGEYIKGYYVDENGNDCYTDGGFRYYGADAYKDGKMEFKGTVSFWRYFDSLESFELGTEDQLKNLSCDIALTCFYMPIETKN